MSMPFLNVIIRDKEYPALVDTGASVSLISEKLIPPELLKLITITNRIVQDASGTIVPIKGVINATISTPGGDIEENLLVLKKTSELSVRCLIGMNILQYAILNFNQETISFLIKKDQGTNLSKTMMVLKVSSNKLYNNEGNAWATYGLSSNTKNKVASSEIKAVKIDMPKSPERETDLSKKPSINLHLEEDLNLTENAIIVTEIGVPLKRFRNKMTIITHYTEHKQGIVVANAVTNVSKNKIVVNVINFNDEPVVLKKGTKLCSVNLLNKRDGQFINCVTDNDNKVSKTESFKEITQDDITCGNPEMKNRVLNLLNKYRKICWLEGEPLGHYTGEALKIELRDNDAVVNQAPYRIPHAKQDQLANEIREMLEQGVISKSISSFNSPLLIVPKPNGKIRPCIDYRRLNDITIPIAFPIPRISDLLNSLSTTKVITALDLASAYHQCEVREEDRHKTAFTVGSTKYEFNRVAFGMTNAPSYFARIINQSLSDILGSNLVAYMDDLLIFSENEDQHLEKLEQVLSKLSLVNLKIKTNKCLFFAKQVKFLGFIISDKGMQMDAARTQSLSTMPYPKNKKQLQAFLGACNYYRSFVRNFADIADPLYELLRKNVPFTWTDAQAEAVDLLKLCLGRSPILKFPNFKKDFHLHSDASLVGIAACLLQNHEGTLHPLAYVSRCLSEAQRNYSTTKRECLALVFALEQFRHLILYYEVNVYTDHQPLIGIIAKPTRDPCMNRWALLVQEYEIKLHYLPGKQNIFSDALSRLVDVTNNCESLPDELDEKLISKIAVIKDSEDPSDVTLHSFIPVKVPWSEEELRIAQKSDEKCKEIRQSLSAPSNKTSENVLKFKVIKNMLYVLRVIKRGPLSDEFLVPYVPDSLMKAAFKVLHNDTTAGHKGYERTLKLFRRNFYHKTESQYIRQLCDHCEWCLKAKATPKPIPLSKYPIPIQPFQTISSDILGKLPITTKGNQYILTFRDFTTRYTVLVPLEYKDADSVIEALRQVISHYGSCSTLLTDNAKEYTSEKLKKFCDYYNIQKTEVSPYRPSNNGLAERVNKEVNTLLRIYTNQLATNDWDELLPVIQLTINNTHNVSLGDTPFFVLFGYDSPTVTLTTPKIDYQDSELATHIHRITTIREHCRINLLKMQAKYSEPSKRSKIKLIEIGQRVYAKLDKQIPKSKLDLPVSGPFTVIGRKGKAFKLQALTSEVYIVDPALIILSPAQLTAEKITARHSTPLPAPRASTESKPVSRYPLRNRGSARATT